MELPVVAAIVRGIEACGTALLIDNSIGNRAEKGSIASVLRISIRRSFLAIFGMSWTYRADNIGLGSAISGITLRHDRVGEDGGEKGGATNDESGKLHFCWN